jgi:hypothetical protein
MDDLAPPGNVPQSDGPAIVEAYDQQEGLSLPRRLLRGFGILLVIVAVLLGVYGTVAYAASSVRV